MSSPASLLTLFQNNAVMDVLCVHITSASICAALHVQLVSPHIEQTICEHLHVVVKVHVCSGFEAVYVKLWLTPSRCSCWQSRWFRHSHIFPSGWVQASIFTELDSANMLNCWPPFILGLSHKRLRDEAHACELKRRGWVGGVGEIPQWHRV